MDLLKTVLCCFLGLILVMLILGGVGSTDYADARLQEKDICSRTPHPGWCAHDR